MSHLGSNGKETNFAAPPCETKIRSAKIILGAAKSLSEGQFSNWNIFLIFWGRLESELFDRAVIITVGNLNLNWSWASQIEVFLLGGFRSGELSNHLRRCKFRSCVSRSFVVLTLISMMKIPSGRIGVAISYFNSRIWFFSWWNLGKAHVSTYILLLGGLCDGWACSPGHTCCPWIWASRTYQGW